MDRDLEFPTYVGMNRRCSATGLRPTGVPHIRGDEPQIERLAEIIRASSPHTWG